MPVKFAFCNFQDIIQVYIYLDPALNALAPLQQVERIIKLKPSGRKTKWEITNWW